MVLVLTVVTCFTYLIFWYYRMYRDLGSIMGRTPTGLPFIADVLLAVFTAGLWGIYVDYCISRQLLEIRNANGLNVPDSMMTVLIMDSLSIFTAYILFIVTSAIQQDEWNKMIEAMGDRPFQRLAAPANPA